MYFFYGADSPRQHKGVSEKEVAYIESSTNEEITVKVNSFPGPTLAYTENDIIFMTMDFNQFEVIPMSKR